MSGVLLAICQQSPAMYAYLRDAEVDEDGLCWLVFFKLPPDVVRNLGQVINVKDKKAYEFQQHGVLFTAFKLQPSDEEMITLDSYYHDKSEEGEGKENKVEGPDDEQKDSAADRLASSKEAGPSAQVGS